MLRKFLWINTIIGILLFFWACTPTDTLKRKYIGKNFKPHHFKHLNDSGHHFHETEIFDIKYDYSVDHNKKTITFDGTLKYAEKISESMFKPERISLNITRCDLGVLFADENGTIVSAQVFHIPPGEIIYHPTQFKKVLPYSDNYKLIVMGAYIITEE